MIIGSAIDAARGLRAMRDYVSPSLAKASKVIFSVTLTFSICATGPFAPGTGEAVAKGGDRTLWVRFTHTGEEKKITFRRNGRYVQEGLKQLSWLTRDWRRNEPTKMDPRLFDLVWSIYQESGATRPIMIVSGYRSKKTNDALRRRSRGVARFSQHSLGKAMDFYIPGVPASKIREIGLKMQEGGVGYYPGSATPFVHMDTGNVRHWPRMSSKLMARLFPDGKTLHKSPRTGGRMPKYAEALADYKSRRNKVIQPLSKSKRSRIRVAGRDRDDASRGLLGGIFRSDDKNAGDSVQVASTTRVNERASKPVVTAKASAPKIKAVPRERPASAPVVVANNVDAEQPKTIRSRIGREDNSDNAPVVIASAPIPRPLPAGLRDATVNDNAIVIAANTDVGSDKTNETERLPSRYVLASSTDAEDQRNPNELPGNVSQTVTASLVAQPSDGAPGPSRILNEEVGTSSPLKDPTRLVLRSSGPDQPTKSQTSSSDLRLAFADPSAIVDDPATPGDRGITGPVGGNAFDKRFGDFEVASNAVREAARAATLAFKARKAAGKLGFDDRFDQPAEAKIVNLAALGGAGLGEGDDRQALKQALVERLNPEAHKAAKREAAERFAERRAAFEKSQKANKNRDAFKKEALRKIQKTGLLTTPVMSYEAMAVPNPSAMPQLFVQPVSVYAGTFSLKGDRGTDVRFKGNAIKPTPTVRFGGFQLSQLSE
ncbi:MAG: DUF882 domain-containing protein [Pseudomonadota bacterium]